MIQFFAESPEERRMLSAEESAHAVRVLRKSVGDIIHVTDGLGWRYRCVLTSASPKGCAFEVLDKEHVANEWPCRITLGVAPTKHSDRMEWLVEKAVEIGVDRIVLLRCAHSERKEMKVERLRKVALSAMKQSLHCYLPEVTEITPFAQFIVACGVEEQKLMGYCDDDCERRLLTDICLPARDTVILIGPEGDFSPEEVTAARESGFEPTAFCEARLRTETAALFGLQAVHIINMLGHRRYE